MKKSNVLDKPFMQPILLAVYVVVLALTFMVALPQSAYAGNTPVPPVPANIRVPEGNKLVLIGHAVGTQNYICLPAGTGVQFTLFTPQATLFDERNEQIMTHFFSLNPGEAGVVRAAWQSSQDTSTVWGRSFPGASSSDPDYVAPGAIPWLLVTVLHTQNGPTGGDKLSEITFIQRLNTSGGVSPSTGCAALTDVGHQAFVPYEADYYFYKKTGK